MRVFEVEAGNQRLIETLRKHDGPVWQVAWAHPRFGTYLASCSYDGQVILWGDFSGRWEVVFHHRVHEASGTWTTRGKRVLGRVRKRDAGRRASARARVRMKTGGGAAGKAHMPLQCGSIHAVEPTHALPWLPIHALPRDPRPVRALTSDSWPDLRSALTFPSLSKLDRMGAP